MALDRNIAYIQTGGKCLWYICIKVVRKDVRDEARSSELEKTSKMH